MILFTELQCVNTIYFKRIIEGMLVGDKTTMKIMSSFHRDCLPFTPCCGHMVIISSSETVRVGGSGWIYMELNKQLLWITFLLTEPRFRHSILSQKMQFLHIDIWKVLKCYEKLFLFYSGLIQHQASTMGSIKVQTGLL